MESCSLSHLEELEAESIHLLRETASQFQNTTLLFSGGKDSLVCLHLIAKAFYPANSPFVALHVDTGHNFPEALAFRDQLVDKIGERLIVHEVQDMIDKGMAAEDPGPFPSRNRAQIPGSARCGARSARSSSGTRCCARRTRWAAAAASRSACACTRRRRWCARRSGVGRGGRR